MFQPILNSGPQDADPLTPPPLLPTYSHASVCNCCFFVLSRYTLFFAGRLVSKQRSILIAGPSDAGKSFFGSLVRYQLPRGRVFLPLAASEFCWDELNPMRILGFSNDWRFSQKVPTQPCLNWLEGLEFKYNRKRQKAGEGRRPLCIFTSNEMDKGWRSADIAAFYARMACAISCFVKMEMVGVKEPSERPRGKVRKVRSLRSFVETKSAPKNASKK